MGLRLEGKTALVTGAGSGIGLAVAQRFVAEGATVYFADINVEAAAATGASGAHALRMDISDEASVIAAYAAVAGKLDVVVANAGVQLFGQDAKVGDLDLAVWEKTVTINQRGAFLTLKHAVRAMEGHGGSIICTGSPTAVVACGQTFTAYTSSKAGVHGLARVVAADYAHAGIRVNIVVPGYTETPWSRPSPTTPSAAPAWWTPPCWGGPGLLQMWRASWCSSPATTPRTPPAGSSPWTAA